MVTVKVTVVKYLAKPSVETNSFKNSKLFLYIYIFGATVTFLVVVNSYFLST